MLSFKIALRLTISLAILPTTYSLEEGYLRYVKDGCFVRGEALSCVKYKALKMATKTIFGFHGNETLRASNMISFVPLDSETLKKSDTEETFIVNFNEPRGFMSEWAELTRYAVKLVTDFIKTKALKVNLPEEARTIEEETVEDGRSKRKRLALILPILTLVAAAKTKLLLIPVLLTVLFIKKLLLLAALLLPSLLNTLKACKLHHGPSFFSQWGSSDSSDYNSDYGNTYSYSSNSNYGKDWAANRAYNLQKPRPSPMYITAPGAAGVA